MLRCWQFTSRGTISAEPNLTTEGGEKRTPAMVESWRIESGRFVIAESGNNVTERQPGLGGQDMATRSEEFWGIVKSFGPLAALHVLVYAGSAAVFQDNRTWTAVAQLTGALMVTALGGGLGYRAGKRDGLSEAQAGNGAD